MAKSLPVLVIWTKNVLKLFSWLKDTSETCCPCPFPVFAIIFTMLTTLSWDKKLTHDKTLHLDFTKKMGQQDIAFIQDIVFCWHFLNYYITRITFWNNFSGLCIKFIDETRHQIRYLGQNITNSQISTFDASETSVMCNKGIL